MRPPPPGVAAAAGRARRAGGVDHDAHPVPGGAAGRGEAARAAGGGRGQHRRRRQDGGDGDDGAARGPARRLTSAGPGRLVGGRASAGSHCSTGSAPALARRNWSAALTVMPLLAAAARPASS